MPTRSVPLQDSVTAFQTSFFSFLSLVFAIYSGNTMAFLYDVRPKSAVCVALVKVPGAAPQQELAAVSNRFGTFEAHLAQILNPCLP